VKLLTMSIDYGSMSDIASSWDQQSSSSFFDTEERDTLDRDFSLNNDDFSSIIPIPLSPTCEAERNVEMYKEDAVHRGWQMYQRVARKGLHVTPDEELILEQLAQQMRQAEAEELKAQSYSSQEDLVFDLEF
jgi:hypothetical protein